MTEVAITTDSLPPSTPNNIAKLPGNVEVELIGVSFHPSTGNDWWRPDGSELKTLPDLSDDGKFTVGSDAQARATCREFLIQIRGLPKDHSIRTDYGASAATGSSFKDGVWTGYHGAGSFKDLTTSIKLCIATVPYGPVMTIDPSGMKTKRIAIGENLGSLYDLMAPVGVNDNSGETGLLLDNISYSKLHELAEWELHAVDNDGARHRHYTAFVPDMPNYPCELFFRLPNAKISRFEYRVRPYRHFVTFENVSLEPGQKSDVTVSVKSLPSGAAQAFIPNGPMIQLLGVSTPPIELPSNDKREWWSGAELLELSPVQPGVAR
ncbi:MAG: hypothetical protein WKF77_27415 [Planctomycetaceae bacterium]